MILEGPRTTRIVVRTTVIALCDRVRVVRLEHWVGKPIDFSVVHFVRHQEQWQPVR